jgi:hypothetical protein
MATPPRFTGRPLRQRPPDGEVRQSQVVTTYGPGALVDLVHDAVIVGGLDFWHFGPGDGQPIDEPRLRDALALRFQKMERPLHPQAPFRRPPASNGRDAAPSRGIDVLEFPRWFVCQNPRCRALEMAGNRERRKDRYWHDCDDGKAHECVPVRFVAACKNGHIDEFPWMGWTHEKVDGGLCDRPRLRLIEGATGDFADITVSCVCGARRRLIEASVDAANPHCRGRRPWLGSEGDEKCDQPIRLLTRSASHVYFSQVESAVSIPEPAFSLRDVVQDNWDVLQNISNPEILAMFRTNVPKLKALGDAAPDLILQTIAHIRDGIPAAREPMRTAEYRMLIGAPPEAPGETPRSKEVFHARRVDVPVQAGIAAVVLVKKLRQVRVQVGFTRLESSTANLQGEFDLGVRSQQLGLNTDWLPASEINGEGIFLQLDEARVRTWETNPAVVAREDALKAGFQAWAAQRNPDAVFPGARFYLLHSLAHMIATALSIECGYPASSITERLYCAPHDDAVPMAGLMLLTGSPSAEGSLGGLVEEGRRLKHHLQRALDVGRLCSNDPVCAQHSPGGDLAERHLEGAACHGCLYVAECSCERFNNFLDRALVVPTLGPTSCAFFGDAE